MWRSDEAWLLELRGRTFHEAYYTNARVSGDGGDRDGAGNFIDAHRGVRLGQ